MRISRKQVENLIRNKQYEYIAIRYFRQEKEIKYNNLDQINWNNVHRAAVVFKDCSCKWSDEAGEFVPTNRKRVK